MRMSNSGPSFSSSGTRTFTSSSASSTPVSRGSRQTAGSTLADNGATQGPRSSMPRTNSPRGNLNISSAPSTTPNSSRTGASSMPSSSNTTSSLAAATTLATINEPSSQRAVSASPVSQSQNVSSPTLAVINTANTSNRPISKLSKDGIPSKETVLQKPGDHLPLRLITSATCVDTYTSLVSARSPPHSPTLAATSPSTLLFSSEAGGSRGTSILDGIQGTMGVSASAPSALLSSSPLYSLSSSSCASSISSGSPRQGWSSPLYPYSSAKNSLADISNQLPPPKRILSFTRSRMKSGGSNNMGGGPGNGVVRSRSNYVSFPSFDDVDFLDLGMVEDIQDEEVELEEDDEKSKEGSQQKEDDSIDDDDHWSTRMEDSLSISPSLGKDKARLLNSSALDEQSGAQGQRSDASNPPVSTAERVQLLLADRKLGIPTSPSQHWLLQLESNLP